MLKFITLIIFPIFLFSQTNQIYIDGAFNDWQNINSYDDVLGDTDYGTDFLSVAITNDSRYLYINFTTSEDIDLLDSGINDIELYNIEILIDTDNNNETGFSPSFNDNIGCELGIMLNQRFTWYNVPEPDIQISLYDIGVLPAPTVTSNQFEIAIDLAAEYNGLPLFPNSECKIQITDWISQDKIPNNGSEIIYNLNSNNLEYPVKNTNKEFESLIRLSAYNVLYNGFDDSYRLDFLKNTLRALDSDIFAFSECSETSTQTVENILNETLPLDVGNSWEVIKKENDDLILASRFPIIEDWPNNSTGIKSMHPCLIDLPDDIYATDLLVINAHMSCCSKDSLRQIQADDFVHFILDAKSPGGEIDLDEGTPFVLCGDLNLVGFSQQLNTILTGDIINNDIYGPSGGMNWSNNNLKDEICWNTDLPLSYTWRDLSPANGSYPSGRLDFIIFSDDVMSSEKAFSIDTETMSQESLNETGLNFNDSRGSDHLAITADFHIPLLLEKPNQEMNEKKILRRTNILGQKKENVDVGINVEIYNDGTSLKKWLIPRP